MYFLGMDVGTGGTRTVLINERGQVIAAAATEHAPFRSPQPGWAEQDPEDWWRAAQESIREALKTSGIPSTEIGAIGTKVLRTALRPSHANGRELHDRRGAGVREDPL